MTNLMTGLYSDIDYDRCNIGGQLADQYDGAMSYGPCDKMTT